MKNNWKIVKIPEVLCFQEGPGVRKHQFTTEGVKLLNGGNINDGQINLSKTKIYISEKEAFGKYKHFLVDEGDLVIASSGIVVSNFHNKIAFIKKEHLPLCMNTSTIRFKVIDKKIININYFKYFLETNFFSEQLQKLITGSAQLNFGPSHLKKIDLLLPPIEDQKRIVKLLDDADALCQKRKQVIELLNEYQKSVFSKMFGDPENNPRKFKVTSVGDITSHIKDGPHVSPKYADSGILILSTRNVRPGELVLDDVKHVSQDTFQELTRIFRPQKGDVLVTKGGTTGYAKVVDFEWPFCVWVHIAVLRPISEIDPVYLEGAMNSDYCYKQSQLYTHGIANRDLGLTRIAKIKLLKPPLEEQRKYASIIRSTRMIKQKMLAQSEELENQFQALMQKAFKGTL